MKKIIGLAIALICTVSGLMAQKTISDANAEVRDAKNFHGISVSHAFDVYLSQGNEEAVAVSAVDKSTRDRIKVEVKNGILHVELEKGSWKWNRGNKKLKAYISFKKIDKLMISGACDVYVDGAITADDLSVNLSGASDIRNVKLDVKKLNIDISGASDMSATGTASQLTVEASGASKFKGAGLATEVCDAKASGASDISITVNKELSVSATGASGIKYKGEALIRDIKTSGSSRVSRI